LTFPNPYPYECGLTTKSGLASFRAIHSIYLALRATELVEGVASPRVMEIGAGLGRSAYYAIKFGLPSYGLTDLPFTAISQGYFLMSTLGPDKISLAGEDTKDRCVTLMTPSRFLQDDTNYDLALNVDSLAEIDPDIAETYWDKIERSTKLFLSINHEANQHTVRSWYLKSQRVKKVTRFPYWLRRGYVEELIEFF
jgi:hypothetical protein